MLFLGWKGGATIIDHKTSIVWFRQDLRLSDNPALTSASLQGEIFPIYILDDENARQYAMGAASRSYRSHHTI